MYRPPAPARAGVRPLRPQRDAAGHGQGHLGGRRLQPGRTGPEAMEIVHLEGKNATNSVETKTASTSVGAIYHAAVADDAGRVILTGGFGSIADANPSGLPVNIPDPSATVEIWEYNDATKALTKVCTDAIGARRGVATRWPWWAIWSPSSAATAPTARRSTAGSWRRIARPGAARDPTARSRRWPTSVLASTAVTLGTGGGRRRRVPLGADRSRSTPRSTAPSCSLRAASPEAALQQRRPPSGRRLARPHTRRYRLVVVHVRGWGVAVTACACVCAAWPAVATPSVGTRSLDFVLEAGRQRSCRAGATRGALADRGPHRDHRERRRCLAVRAWTSRGRPRGGSSAWSTPTAGGWWSAGSCRSWVRGSRHWWSGWPSAAGPAPAGDARPGSSVASTGRPRRRCGRLRSPEAPPPTPEQRTLSIDGRVARLPSGRQVLTLELDAPRP